MKSIDITKKISHTFLNQCGGMDLSYLWDVALGYYNWIDELDKLPNDYNSEEYFFKSLKYLLDNKLCKLRSDSECLSNAEIEKLTPDKQLSLVKEIWVGKEEMDRLDQENQYAGWWFLTSCPYYLAHKKIDENGNVFWLVN